METIQNIFIDSLNGFPKDQIPLFLFQLFCAGIGAHLLQLILNRKTGEKILEHSALIAVATAVMASLVKGTEPLAILGAALLLLFLRGKDKGKLETIALILVVLIGVGCGVGSIVQTVIGSIVIFGIIFFTPLKK